MTRIVISEDNKSYFIGFEDGSVQIINTVDFKFVDKYDYIHDKN